MGRPRSFDEAQAVAAAAAVFRGRGYAATSIDHLVEATRVHRGSLYGVFGSKRGVFLRALDASGVPATPTTDVLDIALVALLELAPDDPEVRTRVDRLLRLHGVTSQTLGARLLHRAHLDPEGDLR